MTESGIADVSTAVGAREGLRASRMVPALTIASHPVARLVGARLLLDGVAAGHEVGVARNTGDFVAPGQLLGVALGDPFISRQPIRFAAGQGGGVRIIVEPGGTAGVAGEPIQGVREVGHADLVAGVALELADRVVLVLHLFDRELRSAAGAFGMVGDSAGIRQVRAAIERVVDLAVPVMIRGETGTGKELVARAIHAGGPRAAAPFVTLNLGAVPRELAAAELFGAVRGAYTGATRDRPGLFRAASGGTLFLDEVGEAAPEIQAMLLRVLETGELYPVGADQPVAIDVRLIAATDAPLEDHIQDGRFKAPLLHRLSGYVVHVPPLRERRDDIGTLLYELARGELAALGELDRLTPRDPYARPWLPARLAAQLIRYPWPGNIRELRNVTRQLVIESRGLAQARIDPRLADQLARASGPRPGAPPPPAAPALGSGVRRKPSSVTEPELIDALRACGWDLQAAADQLGIPRPSIYDLIDRNPSLRTAGDLAADEITRCFAECRGDLDAMAARLQVSRRALGRRVKELGLAR